MDTMLEFEEARLVEHSYTARELAEETMRTVFLEASSFEFNDCADPARQTPLVRSWLGELVRGVIRDLLFGEPRSARLNPESLPGAPPDDDEVREEAPSFSPEQRKLGEEALARLSERERRVLIATHKLRDGRKRLPNGGLEQLAQEFGTSGDNIRAIRSRAMRKVRTWIRSGSEGEQ